jgi:hypothetical protein
MIIDQKELQDQIASLKAELSQALENYETFKYTLPAGEGVSHQKEMDSRDRKLSKMRHDIFALQLKVGYATQELAELQEKPKKPVPAVPAKLEHSPTNNAQQQPLRPVNDMSRQEAEKELEGLLMGKSRDQARIAELRMHLAKIVIQKSRQTAQKTNK